MLSITKHLSSLPLFSGVSIPELHSFVQSCTLRKFSQGELLISQGESADQAMLLVEGKLDVLLMSPDKRLHRLGHVHAGEIFGEQGLFVQQGKRNAQVIAQSDGLLLQLNRSFMHKETQNAAVVVLEKMIIATLARRIRAANITMQKAQQNQSSHPNDLSSSSKYTSLFQHLQCWMGKAS